MPTDIVIRRNGDKIMLLETLDKFLQMPINDFMQLYFKFRGSNGLYKIYISTNFNDNANRDELLKGIVTHANLPLQYKIEFLSWSRTDFNSDVGLLLLEHVVKEDHWVSFNDVKQVLDQGIDLTAHKDFAIELAKVATSKHDVKTANLILSKIT